ncbi:MAG: ABC transporter ATP-binding protein [Syntrophobacteraceae bacterium]
MEVDDFTPQNNDSHKSPTKLALEKVIPLLKARRRSLLLAVVCMIGSSGFTAATAYLIKPAMDDIFLNKNMSMLKLVPFVFVIVTFFNGLCQWGSDYSLKYVGLTNVADLKQKLYNHIQDMPVSFFDQRRTGVIMSRIDKDAEEVTHSITRGLTGFIRDIFTILGLIFVVFYQNWMLAIIGVVLLPVVILPMIRFGSRMRKLAVKRQNAMASLNATLQETISGNHILKAFCMEEYEKKRFAVQTNQVLKYMLKSEWIEAMSAPITECLAALAIAGVIGFGGYQVIQGIATPGSFFSFLGAIIMMYRPIKDLSKVNNVLQRGITSILRIYSILDMKSTLVELPGAMELPQISNSIEFRHVSFGYENKLILHDVNLKVKTGEIIALVGSSGAGKTTLVNLIPRFYDVTEGAILFDGIDIREVTFCSLRSQIAIVTQQSFLFHDTVWNNIAYGSHEKSEEKVLAAATAAYAYDFIMQFEHGFDTVVGERGVKLSGGQMQRICIARALLKDAPVLILDEATSSLDSESELEVQMALDNLMKGRTTFVIAHRLSTIQSATRILVLANGRIVEEGTQAHLLGRDGEYRRLYDMQFHKSLS